MVCMTLANNTRRDMEQVFSQFASSDEDFGFNKTIVPVRLAQYGEERLMSRSQAKRVLARFDRFRHVLLDFTGVKTIGQGFADEVFRVFVTQHPEVRITPINANESVTKMINHMLNSR